MQYLTDIPAAMNASGAFLITHARDFPAAVQAAMAQAVAQPSPVDQIVIMGETLYALGTTGTAASQTLCGQLIEFASRYSWHGLGGGRGAGIVSAMCRDLGETAPASGWPAASADPAPREDLVAAMGLTATSTSSATAS